MSLDDAVVKLNPGTAAEMNSAVRRIDQIFFPRQKITRAEELRKLLADEIVRGVRAPGSVLDETKIAHQFRVSRTPVREALRQLIASGLVDARAHRRAAVARPSLERLTGMFEAMAELEATCAGFAAERMLASDRRALETIHEQLRMLSREGNPDRFREFNERFHNAIYAGSQNNYIAEITLATRARVQPFRRAQFRNLGRLAKSHAEHDRVVTAINRGDRAGAAAAMRRPHRTGARRIRNLFGVALDFGHGGLRHEGAPASKPGDVASTGDRGGFDQETFHRIAIGEPHRPDR